MRPFNFVYKVVSGDAADAISKDRCIGQIRHFIRQLEREEFGVEGREPRAFYDGSDRTYVIWDTKGYGDVCGHLGGTGLLTVLNEPDSRLLGFMEQYEVPVNEPLSVSGIHPSPSEV